MSTSPATTSRSLLQTWRPKLPFPQTFITKARKRCGFFNNEEGIIHNMVDDVFCVLGAVGAHRDVDFPSVTRAICLYGTGVLRVARTRDGSVDQDYDEAALSPGLAFQFNCHREHMVLRRSNEWLIWASVDDHDNPDRVGIRHTFFRDALRAKLMKWEHTLDHYAKLREWELI